MSVEQLKDVAQTETGARSSWSFVFTLIALAICWLVLTIQLTRQYSPTMDEVPHAASSWAIRATGDFRVNPEHPPLWKILSAIPHAPDALTDELESPLWTAMPSSFILEWPWAANLLYGEEPQRGLDYIRRGRRMIVLFGLLLGVVIVWWSARLAGLFAGVLAAVFFVLEPNILAHSSLVTSDVPFTATLFLTLFILARWGTTRRPYLQATAAGISLGLCLATKFSALILPPVAAGLILLRPFLHEEPTFRRRFRARLLELLIVALVSYAVLWVTYGFRFSPSPGGELLDVSHAVGYLEYKAAASGTDPGGPVMALALFAERTRLLPQAYCVGLIWAKATTLGQPAFLLGELSSSGWWYYFPVTLLVKLPTILILALVAATIIALRDRRRTVVLGTWNRAVLLLTPAAVLIVAMGSGLNIGLRHVLPVVPALIILAAISIAGATHSTRSRVIVLSIALILGGGELLLIHPHELSYFNLLSGGPRRGIEILGDSNLDWGQDLSRLGRWSSDNPCATIHLAYYGSTPPEAFGVNYIPLPVREGTERLPALRTEEDEVIIVSSRYLQGFELSPEVRPFYELLRATEPTEVIGTTLYVYRTGPQASCAGG